MINNLIAFKILTMLVKPFNETEAYKLGIIDEKGKLLKELDQLKTTEEKDAYDMLHRLVFNLKRLLAKLPGGSSKLASYAAAYFLVRENLDNDEIDEELLESDFNYILSNEYFLVEETALIVEFLALSEDAPVNSTGPAVSSDEPVVNPKKRKKLNSVIMP